MHAQFANPFYSSRAWKKCRAEYARSVGGLCEACLRRGIVKQGEQVHHKVALTPENIDDPRVTISWANLELLCEDCHKAVKQGPRRWTVDASGRVTA